MRGILSMKLIEYSLDRIDVRGCYAHYSRRKRKVSSIVLCDISDVDGYHIGIKQTFETIIETVIFHSVTAALYAKQNQHSIIQ